MQIITPPLVRSYWYDRSINDVSIGYSGSSIAPHAATERSSYTVPANKVAVIKGYYIGVKRQTVATTLANTTIYIDVTPSGGSAVLKTEVKIWTNTLNMLEKSVGILDLIVTAGDKVAINTVDLSTGGTLSYVSNISINEFDA